jgi:hypothetical protein
LVFLGFSDAPFPLLFAQCLAQDVVDMAELREELTQVRVTAIMVEARAARLDEVAQKVSFSGVSLRLRARLVIRPRRSSWVWLILDRAVDADRRLEGAEGQYEALAEELTLLRIRGGV